MKILVTGAAGFIGSYLSRALIRRGDDVVGIDNFSDYYPRECKDFNLDVIYIEGNSPLKVFSEDVVKPIYEKMLSFNNQAHLNKTGIFKFVEIDIRDEEKINLLFENEKIDAVIHLAAMAGVRGSIKKPVLYSDVNVTGTTVLLEACAKNNVKKFIFGSSSSVYGEREDVPFKETDDVSKPISTYAASKAMGELICYTYHNLYKINVVCVRIFGPIFGPLQRFYGMAAQKFIKQVHQDKPITIYGDGTMARDSTYIDDEVSGLVKALDSNISYDIINVGVGSPVSVLELAQEIIKNMGKGEIIHLDKPGTEVPITFADISKAKSLLGYSPSVPFKEGIRRQVEVFKMMPDWYKSMEERTEV